MDPLIRIRIDDTLISLAQLDSIKFELEKGEKNDSKNDLMTKANGLLEKIRENIPKISLFGNYVSNIEAKYLKQINQRFKMLSNWYKNYQYQKPNIKIENLENPTTSQSIITRNTKSAGRSKSVPFKNSVKPLTINEKNDSQIESIECSLNEDFISNSFKSIISKKPHNNLISSKANKMPVVIVTEPKRKRARSQALNDSFKKTELNLDINLNDESNSDPIYSNNNVSVRVEKGLRMRLIQDYELFPINFTKITMKDFQFD